MFEDKVLIFKLPAINGLPACAVVVGEVASLAHKLRDDAMKAAALVAKALFMCAQAAEVLCTVLEKKSAVTFNAQFGLLWFLFAHIKSVYCLFYFIHYKVNPF